MSRRVKEINASSFETKLRELELERNKREERKLQEEELNSIQTVFNIYDVHGNGTIDGSQLPDVLRAMGLNPTIGLVEKLTGGIRTGDMQFTVEEFVPIYAKCRSNKDNGVYEDFIECLKLFDKAGNGLMPLAELSHTLTVLGEKLDRYELDSVLKDCMDPEDEDGYIPYIPFLARVCEKPVPKDIKPL